MSNAKSRLPNVRGTNRLQSETDYEEQDEQEPHPEEPELPVGVIFEVLKNERRRRVIRYLRDVEEEVTLGEVSEHIAALENDKDVSQITYAERKRVYVGLYQCHLPKMDDMGIVDFNRSRGLIELTDSASCLSPYMDEPEPTRPWYQYYGGLSGAGLGLAMLGGLQALPVPTSAALLVVVLCFAGLATAHAYEEYPEPESKQLV